MTHFLYPHLFWLLPLPLLLMVFLPPIKGLHGDALRVPFIKTLKDISVKSGAFWNVGKGEKRRLNISLAILFVIWSLLLSAAARPQFAGDPIRLNNAGKDILLILDISTSMLEPDFAIGKNLVTRLMAVQKTAAEFVEKRANDRIGLVLFGTRAYLQVPITFDKKSVVETLMNTEAGMAGNSTAIGDALGTALRSLRNTEDREKKIIVLLTDGENNDGSLSMQQAIDLASREKVKVYTIGVGSGQSFMQSFFGVNLGMSSSDLDEKSLQKLAEATKGRYFLAEDTKTLEKIYSEIDKLEASANETAYIREIDELYYIPLAIALLLGFALVLFVRRY